MAALLAAPHPAAPFDRSLCKAAAASCRERAAQGSGAVRGSTVLGCATMLPAEPHPWGKDSSLLRVKTPHLGHPKHLLDVVPISLKSIKTRVRFERGPCGNGRLVLGLPRLAKASHHTNHGCFIEPKNFTLPIWREFHSRSNSKPGHSNALVLYENPILKLGNAQAPFLRQ